MQPTSSFIGSGYSRVQPNRILYEVPCKVCRDNSSGKHYGIYSCDGCAGFFKRSIRRDRNYVCISKSEGHCLIDRTHRNQCRACRLQKCLDAGMKKDHVQNERGPRNATGQMDSFLDNKNLIPQTQFAQTYFGRVPYQSPQISAPIYLDLSINLRPPSISHPSYPQPPTSPLVPIVPIEAVHETAAQIFLDNVTWIKSQLKSGRKIQLPMSDQLIILEDSWKNFFIIGAAEVNFNFNQLICALNTTDNNQQRPYRLLIEKEVQTFQFILNQLSRQNVDRIEFGYLREIILFKTDNYDCLDVHQSESTGGWVTSSTNNSKQLREINSVRMLYDIARDNLKNYTSSTPGRYRNLINTLPHFKNVSNFTIEELFFRQTIRDGTIFGILLNIYRTEDESRSSSTVALSQN